jgi:hypothetical protein
MNDPQSSADSWRSSDQPIEERLNQHSKQIDEILKHIRGMDFAWSMAIIVVSVLSLSKFHSSWVDIAMGLLMLIFGMWGFVKVW